jgi:hypothetical protein
LLQGAVNLQHEAAHRLISVISTVMQ